MSNFDTSNVTDMVELFKNCQKLTELKIDNFNMVNVASYGDMLYNVPSTITIKTNATTATWLKEKFTNITDANLTIV